MNKILKVFVCLIFFVAFWQFLVNFFQIPEYIFPSPLQVINAYVQYPRLFLENLLITTTEAISGFIIANLISICVSIVMFYIRKTENVIMSIAVILKTIPIIAITPLLVLWLGSGLQSRIATASLICFFPALVNLLRGIKSIDSDLIDLFKIYNSTWLSTLNLLVMPSTFPYLFSSLKISSSLAVVGALVGEFIGANKGLGFIIIVNYYNSNTAVIFAAIILSSALGVALFYILHYLENKNITWIKTID